MHSLNHFYLQHFLFHQSGPSFSSPTFPALHFRRSSIFWSCIFSHPVTPADGHDAAAGVCHKDLKSPSETDDPMTDGKTASLAAYFGATSTESSHQSSGASSTTRVRARPTWPKDGITASTRTSLGVSHQSISVFLDWLQRYQFQVQCRSLQLVTEFVCYKNNRMGNSPKQELR